MRIVLKLTTLDWVVRQAAWLILLGFGLCVIEKATGNFGILTGVFTISLGAGAGSLDTWRNEPGIWILACIFIALFLPTAVVLQYMSLTGGMAGSGLNFWRVLDFAAGTAILLFMLRFMVTVAFFNYSVKANPSIAERCNLLRKAAGLGCVQAQRDLGCHLCWGEYEETGFAKDDVEGRMWYLKAAEAGHTDAQYNVGLMFLFGEGGEVDIPKGLSWLHMSASSKNCVASAANAADVLADIYEKGYYGVPVDQTKVLEMRKRAVDIDAAFEQKYHT